MDILKDGLSRIGGLIAGDWGELVAKIGGTIIDGALNEQTAYNQKLMCLRSHDVAGWQYTEEILKVFVKRTFIYYETDEQVSISKVKSEIEFQKLARNVILTGPAGSGKSTALKWLFMNSRVRGYSFLYLCAKMFDECTSLQAVLDAISEAIAPTNHCLVFFDGLDELKCIKGTDEEFQELVEFFNKKSRLVIKENQCHRFVVSTRPEHFSFHKMIKKKHFEKSLDNYIIYELQLLTPKETLKICRSMEALSMYDREKKFGHFIDKWPTSDKRGTGMTKAQYLRHLKKYLRRTPLEQSLLTLPLLCRYAYPIIREWSSQDHVNVERVLYDESAQIQIALTSYIKWEFHDTHTCQTTGGEGKTLLVNYQRKVHGFLTEIAGIMGTEDCISKTQWERRRKAKKLSGNISFCVLQEADDENMSFVHPLFKDYYLASYCVKMVESTARKRNFFRDKDLAYITKLLGESSLVPLMYAQQLLECNYAPVKEICKYMLLTAAHDDFPSFVKYASGRKWYMYTDEAPFTIEEYLVVFPLGGVKYHDIFFNVSILNELKATGMLNIIENADNCLKCNPSKISKNLTLIGVKSSPAFGTNFKHTVREFKVFHNGVIINVGGYWESSITRRELTDILLHSEFRNLLAETDISADAILSSEIIGMVLVKKRIKDEFRRIEEEQILRQWMRNITGLIGDDKNYWCLFDRGTLFVLQMIPENTPLMVELFRRGLSENTSDYVSLYGEYQAATRPIEILAEGGKHYKTADIPVDFDVNIEKFETTENVLSKYYTIHWKNLKLFRKAENGNFSFSKDDVDTILDIREVLDLYEVADHFLEEFPNEKFALYLSDERLFTFYMIGEGSQMVALAEETLGLCEKYQYHEGIWLRKLLLSDDMRYTGEDFKKVAAFAREHIWL